MEDSNPMVLGYKTLPMTLIVLNFLGILIISPSSKTKSLMDPGFDKILFKFKAIDSASFGLISIPELLLEISFILFF